jgi:hypothetical protein
MIAAKMAFSHNKMNKKVSLMSAFVGNKMLVK